MMIFLRSIFNICSPKRAEEIAIPIHPSILSNDPDGLRRHINGLAIVESDLNNLLFQSLRHADQPEIVYLLIKAGANPLAKAPDSKDRIYNVAIQNNRSAALLEMIRLHDAIDVKDGFTDCQSFCSLRNAIKHATAENFSNIVDKAIAQNYPLTLMAAFSCLKYKKFFGDNFSFTKQQAGDALAVMIANGMNTTAFDMMEAGFNIKNGTLYKNPSVLRYTDSTCQKNLQDCIAGTLHAPRVLTPKEKIRELRQIGACTTSLPLPYSHHM
jgi:hypothetical protein